MNTPGFLASASRFPSSLGIPWPRTALLLGAFISVASVASIARVPGPLAAEAAPPAATPLPPASSGQTEIVGRLGCGTSQFEVKSLTVGKGETVHGDRYFMGKSALIEGLLDGDLLALAESAKIPGSVTGDVNFLGQSLVVKGSVGDDVRVLGRDALVEGKIDGDFLAVCGQVTIEHGAAIAGRTLIGPAGHVALNGHFGQDVRALGGEVVFGGIADGNVEIQADVLKFDEDAHIKGNLTYTTREELDLFSTQGAKGSKLVEGKITYVPRAPDKKESKGSFHYLWQLWTFVAAFIVGCVIIALARGPARTIVETAQQETLKSVGLGVLGHIFAPFAGIILMILCLTLPAGVLVLTGWGVLFYMAKLVVSASLADAVLRRMGRTPSLYLALLLGMVAIWILFMVPVVGWLLYYLVVPVLGIGAILGGIRAHARKTSPPAVAPTPLPLEPLPTAMPG